MQADEKDTHGGVFGDGYRVGGQLVDSAGGILGWSVPERSRAALVRPGRVCRLGAVCILTGFFSGLNNLVFDIADQCVEECSQNGEDLGTLLARSACGGVDFAGTFPPLCSRIIQVECQASFDRFVDQNCADAERDLLAAYRAQCSNVLP